MEIQVAALVMQLVVPSMSNIHRGARKCGLSARCMKVQQLDKLPDMEGEGSAGQLLGQEDSEAAAVIVAARVSTTCLLPLSSSITW